MLTVKKLSSYKGHDGVVNVFAPEGHVNWKEVERDNVSTISTEQEVERDFDRLLNGTLEKSCAFRLGAGLLPFVGDCLLMAVRPESVKLRRRHLDVCAGIVETDRGVIGSAFSEGEEIVVLTKDGYISPMVKGFEAQSLRLEASINRSLGKIRQCIGGLSVFPHVPIRINSEMVAEMPHRWIEGDRVVPCCFSSEPENRSLEVVMSLKVPYHGEMVPIDTEGFAPSGEAWRPSDGDGPDDPRAGRMTFMVNTKTAKSYLLHRGKLLKQGDPDDIQEYLEDSVGIFKFNDKVWRTIMSMRQIPKGLRWIEDAPHA